MFLNQLFPDFNNLSSEKQKVFFSSYREKRDEDLSKTTTFKMKVRKKGSGKKKEKKIKVSTEAFELLKKLNLV